MIFRLTVAGTKIGDGVVIEGCEISDLSAEWPKVLAPTVPRSDERYAYILPESARRIGATIRGMLDRGPAPFGATGTG